MEHLKHPGSFHVGEKDAVATSELRKIETPNQERDNDNPRLYSFKGISLNYINNLLTSIFQRQKYEDITLCTIGYPTKGLQANTTVQLLVQNQQVPEIYDSFDSFAPVSTTIRLDSATEVKIRTKAGEVITIESSAVKQKHREEWTMANLVDFCLMKDPNYNDIDIPIVDLEMHKSDTESKLDRVIFVSYHQHARVKDFVLALKETAKRDNHGMFNTFFWLEAFCMNHSLAESVALESDTLEKNESFRQLATMEYIIYTCSERYILLDNFFDPDCLHNLKSVWQLYQMFKFHLSFIFMSKEEIVDFIPEVTELFDLIHVEDFSTKLLNFEPSSLNKDHISASLADKMVEDLEKSKLLNVMSKLYVSFIYYYCYQTSQDVALVVRPVQTRTEWLSNTKLLVHKGFYLLSKYIQFHTNVFKHGFVDNSYMATVLGVCEGYVDKALRNVDKLANLKNDSQMAGMNMNKTADFVRDRQKNEVMAKAVKICILAYRYKDKKLDADKGHAYTLLRQATDVANALGNVKGEYLRKVSIAETILAEFTKPDKAIFQLYENLTLHLVNHRKEHYKYLTQWRTARHMYQAYLQNTNEQRYILDSMRLFETAKIDLMAYDGHFPKKQYVFHLAEIKLGMGLARLKAKLPDAALVVFHEAKQLLDENRYTTNFLYGTTCQYIGLCLAKYKERYDDAIAVFKAAIDVIKKCQGENLAVAETLSKIGATHKSIGNRAKAERYFNLALNMLGRLPDSTKKVNQQQLNYRQLGKLYEENQRPDKAIEFYERCYEIIVAALGAENEYAHEIQALISRIAQVPEV